MPDLPEQETRGSAQAPPRRASPSTHLARDLSRWGDYGDSLQDTAASLCTSLGSAEWSTGPDRARCCAGLPHRVTQRGNRREQRRVIVASRLAAECFHTVCKSFAPQKFRPDLRRPPSLYFGAM